MFAIVVENLPLFVILKAKPEGSLKFFGRKLPVCPRAKRLANKQQSSEAEGRVVTQYLLHLRSVLYIRAGALSTSFTFVQSGCWELNPVYLLPKQAYYRYTTARNNKFELLPFKPEV